MMEYCNMGSLSSAMAKGVFCENHDRSSPRVHAIVQAAIDVAKAMKHLHSKGVIHGDLKSQNVLLQKSQENGRDFICKVGDFGLSRLVLNKTHIETFTCGSVRAMPPELLKDGILTPAADVYSFGIMLWELLSGIYQQHKLLKVRIKVLQSKQRLAVCDLTVSLHQPEDKARR